MEPTDASVSDDTLDYRPARITDFDGIAQLHSTVWGRTFDVERRQLGWAFAAAGEGRLPLLIATAGDLVVGVRGGIPWQLGDSAGRRLDVVQLHGTAVHPGFRRRGIFSRLTKAFVDELTSVGYAAIFNVSVTASRLGYEQMGWRYLPGLRRYLTVTGPAAVGIASPSTRGVEIVDATSVDDWASALEAAPEGRPGLARTQWRSVGIEWRARRPDQNYRIAHDDRSNSRLLYTVRSKGRLRIVEVGSLRGDLTARGLRRLTQAAAYKERAQIITVVLSRMNPLRPIVLRAGYVADPRHGDLHLGLRPLAAASDPAHRLDPRTNWIIETIDLDTY